MKKNQVVIISLIVGGIFILLTPIVAHPLDKKSRNYLQELRSIVDEELSNEGKRAKVSEYVRKLSEEGLLSLWEQAASKGDIELRTFAIAGEIKQRWNNNPPFIKIAKIVKDVSRDPVFRVDLLNYLKYPEIRKIIIKSKIEDFLSDELKSIVESKDDNLVREAAVSALGSISLHAAESKMINGGKISEVKDYLLGLLENTKEDEGVRGRALLILERFRDTRVVAALVEIAENQSIYSSKIIGIAAHVLGAYRDEEKAVEILDMLVSNEDPRIRRIAVRSLYGIGTTGAEKVVEDLRKKEKDKSVLRLIDQLSKDEKH